MENPMPGAQYYTYSMDEKSVPQNKERSEDAFLTGKLITDLEEEIILETNTNFHSLSGLD